MEKNEFKLGVWAFIIGLILAIIFALVSGTNSPSWAIIALAILGIIVGLLNVTGREVEKFLVAAIAFLLSFNALGYVFNKIAEQWTAIGTFFNLISVFMAAAAIIVSIKALYNLARD
jgi:hypothetical protein